MAVTAEPGSTPSRPVPTVASAGTVVRVVTAATAEQAALVATGRPVVTGPRVRRQVSLAVPGPLAGPVVTAVPAGRADPLG